MEPSGYFSEFKYQILDFLELFLFTKLIKFENNKIFNFFITSNSNNIYIPFCEPPPNQAPRPSAPRCVSPHVKMCPSPVSPTVVWSAGASAGAAQACAQLGHTGLACRSGRCWCRAQRYGALTGLPRSRPRPPRAQLQFSMAILYLQTSKVEEDIFMILSLLV